MKNSKLRRALLLLASAVLLVCLSVGATLAYLTSTDEVTNTFTVGQVEITLDELDVDKYGDPVPNANPARVPSNEYHLMPGFNYIKDPTIHIDADSEKCWVWAKIVVSEMEGGDIDALRAQLNYGVDKLIGLNEIVSGGVFDSAYTMDTNNVWTEVVEEGEPTIRLEQYDEGDTNVFYVYYLQPRDGGEDLVLFTDLDIPHDWNNQEIANLNKIQMDITAYAIQADGFTDVDEAKEAFDAGNVGQHAKFNEQDIHTPITDSATEGTI